MKAAPQLPTQGNANYTIHTHQLIHTYRRNPATAVRLNKKKGTLSAFTAAAAAAAAWLAYQ